MVTTDVTGPGPTFALLDRGAPTPRAAPTNRSCEPLEFTRSEHHQAQDWVSSHTAVAQSAGKPLARRIGSTPSFARRNTAWPVRHPGNHCE